jgi:hypothetical protein
MDCLGSRFERGMFSRASGSDPDRPAASQSVWQTGSQGEERESISLPRCVNLSRSERMDAA